MTTFTFFFSTPDVLYVHTKCVTMPFGNTKKIYFIIKLIQKTQLKLISIAITINKKTRNMIYLRKRMYRFS